MIILNKTYFKQVEGWKMQEPELELDYLAKVCSSNNEEQFY